MQVCNSLPLHNLWKPSHSLQKRNFGFCTGKRSVRYTLVLHNQGIWALRTAHQLAQFCIFNRATKKFRVHTGLSLVSEGINHYNWKVERPSWSVSPNLSHKKGFHRMAYNFWVVRTQKMYFQITENLKRMYYRTKQCTPHGSIFSACEGLLITTKSHVLNSILC